MIPISSDRVFSSGSPLSAGAVAGRLLFVSGQVPRRADGTWVTGGLAEQTVTTLENVVAVVEAAGAGVDDIVKINAYLTETDNFATFNDAYRSFFGHGALPARTTLCVGLMREEMLVEIEAIAVVPGFDLA